MNGFWAGLDIICDLIILAGYVYIGLKIAPHFKGLSWWTKIGAIFFFSLCGMTHARMAYQHFQGHPIGLIDVFITLPQAVAVWVFVIGIYINLIKPTLPKE